MQQNRTKLALVNLVVLLVVGVAGAVVVRATQALAAMVALCFIAAGFLVTLVSYFQMRLAERERIERLEYDELTRQPAGSALFEAGAGNFPARRAREQFDKFFVPGFAILLMLAEGAGAVLLWRWLARSDLPALAQPTLGMILFALFWLVLFIVGRFSLSLARLENLRLLGPIASFVLTSSYLCAASAVAIVVSAYTGFPDVDRYVARVLTGLLGVVALEGLLTLLLEIYRPRVKGRETRLLYDSRVAGLLAQPESLFTTAAHALDYQFGFKVSETWFYQFLQRAAAWLIAGQVAVLLLSTTFVVIDTGEEALLERFGKPVTGRPIIGPGCHFKWPWPIDKVHRYRTEQIQTLTVGITPEPGEHEERTVLWSVSHAREEFNLLVAARDTNAVAQTNATKKSPPVSLLSVSIPVQFQITNLSAWAYNNSEPDSLLEKLAAREVVRYLVSADFHEMMSAGRHAAGVALRDRIQAAADQRALGARIIFVGLQDVHPPVGVAEAFEHVGGALQSREARVLAAQAYAIQTNALAGARSYKTLRDAEADNARMRALALARGGSFTNQIPAYRAAPSVYTERAYQQVLARNGAVTRKYVIATTNTDDVVLFNLEEKLRTDLLDVQVPPTRAR